MRPLDGLEVIEVEVPYDSEVPAESVRAALERRPDISVVAVVHCETPSGTMNDLDAIGPVVAEHGALLIVDAVSSFGGAPCDVAARDADLVIALTALGRPLRGFGVKADVGAAVEAALASLDAQDLALEPQQGS